MSAKVVTSVLDHFADFSSGNFSVHVYVYSAKMLSILISELGWMHDYRQYFVFFLCFSVWKTSGYLVTLVLQSWPDILGCSQLQVAPGTGGQGQHCGWAGPTILTHPGRKVCVSEIIQCFITWGVHSCRTRISARLSDLTFSQEGISWDYGLASWEILELTLGSHSWSSVRSGKSR